MWADAVARGKTAHGSMPHLGENAIYPARAGHPLAAGPLLRRRAPAARRPDGLARHVLGRHQHQLGARPGGGGDRRPHRAGAVVRRRPRRVAGTARRGDRAVAARGARPDRHRPVRRLGADRVLGHGAADRRDARSRAGSPTSPTPPRCRRPTGSRRRSSAARATPSRRTAPTSRARWRRSKPPARGSSRSPGAGAGSRPAPPRPRRRPQHRRLVEPDELHADRHPGRAGEPRHADRRHAEQRPRAAQQRVAGVALAAQRRLAERGGDQEGVDRPAPPATRARHVAASATAGLRFLCRDGLTALDVLAHHLGEAVAVVAVLGREVAGDVDTP